MSMMMTMIIVIVDTTKLTIMMLMMMMLITIMMMMMMMLIMAMIMTFLASLGSSPRLISLICESSSTSPSLPSLIRTPRLFILFMNFYELIFFSIFRKGATFFKLL
jgi:hypothetical protein